jgi:hypothetical protein
MKAFFKILFHAAVGGFATGATAAQQTGAPLLSKTVLITGLVGALTAVGSLLTKRPQDK